jgi:hypothetical protein
MLRETPDGEPTPIASRISAENRASRSRSPGPSSLVLDDCASVVTSDAASDPRFLGQHSIVSQGALRDGGAAVRQREGAGSALRR